MPRGESKWDGEEKGGEEKGGEEKGDGAAVEIELTSLDVSPNNCPVAEGLDLKMGFTLSAPLQHAVWSVKFVVDSVNARHVIELGNTEPENLSAGPSRVHFSVPSIDVTGVKPCTLANMGLMVASLTGRQGGGRVDVVDVNMVVQVEKRGQELVRCIYSPLE
ncbi:hypothetical protein JKP88DRAFT_232810 [Tribonema minus]|uniref:Uncharacterized protein n=1 Tax=Tribonema minus TaxID=303371 RepID=A0A835ZA11_9STRA|nr:hypothetical protein JKP88DRAFT_232810 [Tribonema minus]